MITVKNVGVSTPLSDIVIDSVVGRILEKQAKEAIEKAKQLTPRIIYKLKLVKLRFGDFEWHDLWKVPIDGS